MCGRWRLMARKRRVSGVRREIKAGDNSSCMPASRIYNAPQYAKAVPKGSGAYDAVARVKTSGPYG